MSSLETLLEKIDEAIRRDISHIFSEVSQGKLSPPSARDLVQYRKLITDAQEASEKAAKGLPSKTEEELKMLAKELLK